LITRETVTVETLAATATSLMVGLFELNVITLSENPSVIVTVIDYGNDFMITNHETRFKDLMSCRKYDIRYLNRQVWFFGRGVCYSLAKTVIPSDGHP
jgi:hypothetical protein